MGLIMIDDEKSNPALWDSTWEDFQSKYPKLLKPALAPLVSDDGEARSIPVVTATALAFPEQSRFRKLREGEEFKDFAARERDDTLAVALAQPHRRGDMGKRAGEPLWEFCRLHALRIECYDAGSEYEQVLRQGKKARGFHVPGIALPGENGVKLTDEQIEAMREAAVMRDDTCRAILRRIMPRAPAVMERLCFDRLGPPAPRDEGLIRHCLVALAVEFGLLKRGINAEKRI